MKNRYSPGKIFTPIIYVAAAFFIFAPALLKWITPSMSSFWISLLFDICMYAAMAAAWNIIGGFGRQLSWTHSSFLAIGAYTSMLLYIRMGLSPWLGMIIGIIFSVILAVVIGIPSFKLSGVYFALATTATCQIVRLLLLEFEGLTRGAAGLMLPYQAENDFLNMRFIDNSTYYYLMLVVMFAAFAAMILISRSRLGYYLKTIRENQIAAESLGVKSQHVKLISLIISAAIMAMVGTVFAFKTAYIEPDSVATYDLSLKIGITVIIGGIGTIWGPLLGAVVSIPLLQITNMIGANVLYGGLSQMLYGLILILLIIFLPNGLLSLGEKRRHAKQRSSLKEIQPQPNVKEDA